MQKQNKLTKNGVKSIKLLTSFLILGLFLFFAWKWADVALLKAGFLFLIQNPFWILAMLLVYGCAFFLRAFAWYLYVNRRISFQVCIHALWYSMFLNHILPIKIGDGVRIAFAMHDRKLSLDEATHSVIVLRLLDLLVLISFSGFGFFYFYGMISNQILLYFSTSIVFLAFLMFFSKKIKIGFVQKHLGMLRSVFYSRKGILIISLTMVSWVLEGIVIYGVSHAFSLELNYFSSVFINSITVAGQVFQILPGGIGTYEAMMTAVLIGREIDGGLAFQIALISHAFKFIFSYLVGIYAIIRSPFHWSELLKNRRGNKR
ncbi:lysylphosphatidylglycerol synthase transmembrane domain-containing protein [Bacillaceae bacterium S4-13-56]